MATKTRKSADKTRSAIIKSATKLFAKNGFSGATMQDIADHAKLNQALLYHHFQNKKTLWHEVKQHILSKSITTELDETLIKSNMKKAITHIINQRFELYSGNKNALRIALWQQLEEKNHNLLGGTSASPDYWRSIIETLQNDKLIRHDIQATFIITWISNSVTAAFMSNKAPLHNALDKESYKDMLINEFIKILQPTS